jgi:hypothetical protein
MEPRKYPGVLDAEPKHQRVRILIFDDAFSSSSTHGSISLLLKQIYTVKVTVQLFPRLSVG